MLSNLNGMIRKIAWVRRDGLFLCILLQAVVYLFLAPFLGAGRAAHTALYAELQWLMLLGYLLPLVAAYTFLVKRNLPYWPGMRLKFSVAQGWRAWVFLVIVVAILLAYWGVAIDEGLLTRRVGSEVVAQRFAALRMPELLAIKLHDVMVLPLGSVMLGIWACEGAGNVLRKLRGNPAGWGLLACSLSALLFGLLNTRSALILVFALAGCIALFFWRGTVVTLARAVVRLIALCVLCLAVLMTARAMYFTEQGWERVGDNAEWADRLDCVDLIARIAPKLRAEGFEAGRAWQAPLTVSFGWLADPAAVREMKAAQMTTAKAYLLDKHTDIALRDHPSCSLTDAYANFATPGFMIAAVFHAVLLCLIAFVFWRHGKWAAVALIPAGTVMMFEHELIGQMLGLVKSMPAILILAALRPFVFEREQSSEV